MINDTTRQKGETSKDIAINTNDYQILELFGWNGSYKYNKTIQWLKEREIKREREGDKITSIFISVWIIS